MKSTRDRILQTLHRQPKRTINELAEAVSINPISVRHHLTNLQMEGLVAADEERHGVGRPRLVYFLTEVGQENFPTRYLRLTTRLLAQMKETMPEPVVRNLVQSDRRRPGARVRRTDEGLEHGRTIGFCKDHAGRGRLYR